MRFDSPSRSIGPPHQKRSSRTPSLGASASRAPHTPSHSQLRCSPCLLVGSFLNLLSSAQWRKKDHQVELAQLPKQELSNPTLNLFSNSTINPTREPQVLEVPLTKAKLQVNDKGYSILCKPPSIELNHRILQPKLTTHYRHTKKYFTNFVPHCRLIILAQHTQLPQEVIKSAHQHTQ